MVSEATVAKYINCVRECCHVPDETVYCTVCVHPSCYKNFVFTLVRFSDVNTLTPMAAMYTVIHKSACFRSPDIVVGGLRFYCDSSSSSSSTSIFLFVIYPPSSVNGTQPKPAICSEVSAIPKCMSEIWGIPYKSSAQNHFFRRLRNFVATLTAYIFGMKHNIHNQASALETTRGLIHCVKMS